MTGREYLKNIRCELDRGRRQNRLGENLLRAFGYVRRRATAIQEINAVLDEFELEARPAVNQEMPLKERITFSIRAEGSTETSEEEQKPGTMVPNTFDDPLEDAEDTDSNLPEPAFSVSELASANTDVKCVPLDASIQEAYTEMLRNKYSQLVVASSQTPRQQDIRGIVSFQSMAKALMNGNPQKVRECIDPHVPIVQYDADLTSVVGQLSSNDVVLVVGPNKRLQGIVTAWDLAEEFAELVDPFKRIGEIEHRLRTLVRIRLEKIKVAGFLRDHGISEDDPKVEIEELTMGELQRVLEFPEHWAALNLPFDRGIFINALDEARRYRNRLMHFRDPLTEEETVRLTNICDMVRQAPIV